MKKTLVTVALGMLAVICGGCANIRPTQSGYLSSYDRAAVGDEAIGRKEPVSLAGVEQIYIEDVSWRVSGDNGFDPEQKEAVLGELRAALVAELARVRPIAQRPGEATARVRVAVTDAKRAAPVLNILTTAAVFVPVFNGGAAFEGELIGPEGRQLLATSDAETGGLGKFFGFFSEKAHAVSVAREYAKLFASKLASESAQGRKDH